MTDTIKKFTGETEIIVKNLKQEMNGIRTNRPNAAFVENVPVSCYNQTMPLKRIGSIGVLPPREIHIQVWDKSIVPNVVKAIESASLGLTAHQDGDTIRIHLPELSAERKEELIRYAKKRVEEFRIQLRKHRDDANKEIQKMLDEKTILEDMKFKLKEEVQKTTDSTNKEMDKIFEMKTQEIKE